jgi:hypothetical protein
MKGCNTDLSYFVRLLLPVAFLGLAFLGLAAVVLPVPEVFPNGLVLASASKQ